MACFLPDTKATALGTQSQVRRTGWGEVIPGPHGAPCSPAGQDGGSLLEPLPRSFSWGGGGAPAALSWTGSTTHSPSLAVTTQFPR